MRRCEVKRTKGDGACAIHSVFGEDLHGEFEKEGARTFLRDMFGPTAGDFSERVGDAAVLSEIECVLWQELVQPCAARDAGIRSSRLALRPEGNIVWAEMTRRNFVFAQRCVAAAGAEHRSYEEFTNVRANVVNEFANLCVRSLEYSFVRPLLEHLGLMEEYEHQTVRVQETGAMVCKLDMLFSGGPQARRLLQSVVEHCGVSHFDVLFERVSDIVGGMELGHETECIFQFCECLDQAQRTHFVPRREPFPDFFQLAYPSYLDALCVANYFLSDVELLALSKCAATSVVIFKHDMASGSLTYLRSTITDASAPLMLTSIQVSPDLASVRTHF